MTPTASARFHSPYPARRAGFTLIELLTVIAIIGILAAIIIPVTGTVRKKARQAQCLSNLKQVFMAVSMYANDTKDAFPPCYGGALDPNYGTSNADNSLTWFWYNFRSPLGNYMGNNTVLLETATCPALRMPVSAGNYSSRIGPASDIARIPGYVYTVNYNVMGTVGSGFRVVKRSEVETPSRFVLMADGVADKDLAGQGVANETSSGGWDDRIGTPHGEKTNFLWCDGHTSSLFKKDITREMVRR